jgi:enoyl-CoA hydratase/carnithine racemase
MSEQLRIIDRDRVRWIELDRPESRNGLTLEINAAIIEALAGAEASDETRVIAIAGAGGHFCSGLDLKDAMRAGPAAPDVLRDRMRTYFHGLIRAVRGTRKPTIAVVDGGAVGFGCDLALACDLRLLSERARFGEIFVKRGLMPDGGSTYTLPRIVGLGRALELMLTGDVIDAAEAHRIGLGNRVYPVAELEASAWAFATALAAGPPLVHQAIKAAVAAALDGDLDAALERELDGQIRLLQSADFFEGVSAFFAKRPPRFTGT